MGKVAAGGLGAVVIDRVLHLMGEISARVTDRTRTTGIPIARHRPRATPTICRRATAGVCRVGCG